MPRWTCRWSACSKHPRRPPQHPQRRGCQLSLRVIGGRERGRALFEHLRGIGVLGDWREPDVIRISPTPLYNRYLDVHHFVEEVEAWAGL